MPGLSIHVVDVSRGIVATGMRVRVEMQQPGTLQHLMIVDDAIGPDGQLPGAVLARRHLPGRYRASFFVGEYYRSGGVYLPAVPFLDIVEYDFGIADPEQHYHLPFKCTPWGYSCFRGGA